MTDTAHRRPPTAALIAALAALAGAALPAAEAGYLLRLRLEPGTTYRMAMDQVQEMEMTLGAMGRQQMVNSNEMVTRLTVKEVDAEGSTLVETAMEKIAIETRQGEAVVFQLDSDSGAGGEGPGAALSSLVGVPYTLKLSPRGEVVEVSGLDEFLARMTASLGDDPQTRPVAELLKQGFSDDSIRQLTQSAMAVFPEQRVAEGESWTHSAEVANPMLGTMTLTTDYRVEGIEPRGGEDCLKVAVATTIEFGGGSPLFDQLSAMGGGKLDMQLGEMTGGGALWVSPATGLTVEMEQTYRLGMTMTLVPPGEAESPPQVMEMQMVQTVRQRLLD